MKYVITTLCRVCQHPLYAFVQPKLVKWRPDREKVECHNPDCPMHMQTLDREFYNSVDLTPYLKTTVSPLAAAPQFFVIYQDTDTDEAQS